MGTHFLTAAATAALCALLALSPAHAQTYMGIEPADPAPGDEVIVTVWRPNGGYDPAVVPKVYVGYAGSSFGPFLPYVAPLSPEPYDPASASYFRVSIGRVSQPWMNVRYWHAANPDRNSPPDAQVTFEVKVRPPSYVQVIEFYSPARDHYFMTADAGEIARLDSGATAGWQRTGESFTAYRAGRSAFGSPVCRFFGRPEYGLDSHFYSSSPAECADVQAKWPAQWQLESANVFEFVYLYSCEDVPGARYLYRVYNGRPDANHRYVTSTALRDAMVAQGWIAEGLGPAAITGCVFP